MVKSHAGTTSLHDSGSGSFSESESSDSQLGNGHGTLVISHSTDNNGSLALVRLLLVVLNQLRQGQRRSVGSRGYKSSQNGLVEAGTGPSSQESEQLDEQVDVKVSAPGVFLVRILNSTSFYEINSLKQRLDTVQMVSDPKIRESLELRAFGVARNAPTICL